MSGCEQTQNKENKESKHSVEGDYFRAAPYVFIVYVYYTAAS